MLYAFALTNGLGKLLYRLKSPDHCYIVYGNNIDHYLDLLIHDQPSRILGLGSYLEGKMKDRQEISELIHILVDRINIYTRKATKKDKIAGRKKDDQKIPYQIRIDLRLPQDIPTRLA